MRAVISEGVLEKRTALLIQNFMEQVSAFLQASPAYTERLSSDRSLKVLRLQHGHACGGLSLLPWAQVAKGGREAKGSLESLGYVPVPEGLDLIEPGDQITHQVLPMPV